MKNTSPSIPWLVACSLLLTLGACESKPAKKTTGSATHTVTSTAASTAASTAQGKSATAPTSQPAKDGAPTSQPAPFTELPKDKLTAAQQAQLERAKRAQKALGSELIKALSAAISEGDYREGIKACSTKADAIATDVASAQGVKIGRSSHKLRNPKNSPPSWARAVVSASQKDAEAPRIHTYEHPDGRLGYLAPIKTGELCLNCHGPTDKLAQGVPKTLAELYPKDEATGFAAGSLRGWFWVEVPRPN